MRHAAVVAGRPSFTAKDRETAESFFITALDKWRQQMGLEKMILMGHSMGGYLAATYALQHPEQIQHLVLVCPAGVVSMLELQEQQLLLMLHQEVINVYREMPGLDDEPSMRNALTTQCTQLWLCSS